MSPWPDSLHWWGTQNLSDVTQAQSTPEIIATDYSMKFTVSLSQLVDFSGF